MSPGSPDRVEVFGVAVGLFQSNCFFLRREEGAETVVVDPGGEGDRLEAIIRSNGWKPVAIVNTHAHLDHIGGVEHFRRAFGVPFLLHPADRPLLEGAPDHAALFGVPAPAVPEIDGLLEDRQTLELAGLKLQIVHTPGHTPGGVSIATGGRVFTGDTLFEGSIGRTDLPGGDGETLIRSIRDRLLPLPDATVVHPGHGPDTTIGRERRSNPFLRGSGAGP